MAEKTLIKNLTDDSFSKEIESGTVLVDFFAEWCGPCRMMAPILEQLASQLQGEVSIGKVDIDSEEKTTAEFQVTSFPTLILFKEGQEAGRLVGLQDAETIKEFISGS